MYEVATYSTLCIRRKLPVCVVLTDTLSLPHNELFCNICIGWYSKELVLEEGAVTRHSPVFTWRGGRREQSHEPNGGGSMYHPGKKMAGS